VDVTDPVPEIDPDQILEDQNRRRLLEILHPGRPDLQRQFMWALEADARKRKKK
jgi:hypothetical protein